MFVCFAILKKWKKLPQWQSVDKIWVQVYMETNTGMKFKESS